MPCNDGRDYAVHEVYRDNPVHVAALCAILTVLENTGMLEKVLSSVDWKEAGVKQSNITRWWNAHKERDQERRAREKAAREKAARKQAVLAKLTPAERKILGV